MAEGTPFGTRFTDSPYKGRLFKTSTEPLCDFVFGDGPVATKSHRGKLFTQKTSCITHISPTRHTNRLTWEDPNSPQSWTSSQRSPGGSPGFRTSSDNEALKTRYSTDKCFKPAAGVTYI
uniref:Uncharacterized protein n=1 Tax=Chromera velia CCMP2878 TaxID=1169474 RepID=A0A0G4H5K7_9ALVE|eukprot:Cvel_24720.t1-p1 / transcript=Cvel_24720.t1 / gene=Cvel_24720 / organism=Chromera_velia_CCMP2878 / gene_product=hypothetical protein / transcript_product=hypothetical protein / location=Cvel_scaffold2712:21065-21421(+) / protein_length=119 / sequence_SO=supercontig / SO=protein_coding / is_pseudo=false